MAELRAAFHGQIKKKHWEAVILKEFLHVGDGVHTTASYRVQIEASTIADYLVSASTHALAIGLRERQSADDVLIHGMNVMTTRLMSTRRSSLPMTLISASSGHMWSRSRATKVIA